MPTVNKGLDGLWEKYFLGIFNKTKYSFLISISSYVILSIISFYLDDVVPEITFLLFGFPIFYNNIIYGRNVGLLTALVVYITNLTISWEYYSGIFSTDQLFISQIFRGSIGAILYFLCCIFFSYMIKREKELQVNFRSLAEELASSANSLAKANSEITSLYTSTIKALASAIEAKDNYTKGHSERVTQIALAIARELTLSPEETNIILYASILHDIGKIGINENILTKPGRLSDEEYHLIKEHPAIGANILSSIEVLEAVIPIVYHHHEYYNGQGYPAKKAGEEIPLGARILAVADAFDAMTSDRPYRKGRCTDSALEELMNNAGTQFDPKVVQAFKVALNKGEIYDENQSVFSNHQVVNG